MGVQAGDAQQRKPVAEGLRELVGGLHAGRAGRDRSHVRQRRLGAGDRRQPVHESTRIHEADRTGRVSQCRTVDWIELIVALAIILFGAQLFTNGVEWIGDRMGLSQGAVGSVLAAIGTALPETLLPMIAILTGGAVSGDEIGVGAIVGAPFMLSTLAMFVLGASLVGFGRGGRREKRLLAEASRTSPSSSGCTDWACWPGSCTRGRCGGPWRPYWWSPTACTWCVTSGPPARPSSRARRPARSFLCICWPGGGDFAAGWPNRCRRQRGPP